MSLFDHIKKKPDVKERHKNESAIEVAEAQEPDSADTSGSDNQIASAVPENQQFDNRAAEISSESESCN